MASSRSYPYFRPHSIKFSLRYYLPEMSWEGEDSVIITVSLITNFICMSLHMRMAQGQTNPAFTRSIWYQRGWDRHAIWDLMQKDYTSWRQSIETMKEESARSFDNQLHSLQSTWPMLDENNELILTGFKLTPTHLRNATLGRDHHTCRICCKILCYCIGEADKNSTWYSHPSIDLQVHHIIPLPSGPNTLDNLITLCKNCHDLLHIYLKSNCMDRGIFEAVFYSFHKCLKIVYETYPLPHFPILANKIDSYLARLYAGE
jgi:predicted HNH restriction endonuclease